MSKHTPTMEEICFRLSTVMKCQADSTCEQKVWYSIYLEDVGWLRKRVEEMLLALKACVESSTARSVGPCKCGACNMARAAIAAAEGAEAPEATNA